MADARLNSIGGALGGQATDNNQSNGAMGSYLANIFLTNRPSLYTAVALLAANGYPFDSRQQWVHGAADRLAVGLPGREIFAVSGTTELSMKADVVNAAWLARVEGAGTPFDRLAEKTIESVELVRNWLAKNGQIPAELCEKRTDVEAVIAEEAGLSVLPEDALLSRMCLDDSEKGLVVAPALHLPKGTGLDLRVGTRFIVFRRTATASFDPLDETNDPRAIQVFVELSQREQFVLHPQRSFSGPHLNTSESPTICRARSSPALATVALACYQPPRSRCIPAFEDALP